MIMPGIVIREPERKWYELGGLFVSTIIDSNDRNGEFGMAELRGRRGCKAPPHIHTREIDELFVVVKGQLTMHCGDDIHVLNVGDEIILPQNIVHWFEITADITYWHALYWPGGYEHFFPEVGNRTPLVDLPEPSEVDPNALRGKAEKYGVIYL
jgi:quercetin dioxygenase-like cupin family protein